eukprot:jgi/Mesvir1/28239/Mv04784-RA.1
MALDTARVVRPVPVPEDLVCIICTGVLQDPVEGDCEHPACRACLDAWLQQPGRVGTCPTCRKPLKKKKTVHRYMMNQILALQVTCDNAGRGCPEVITFEHLRTHVANCGWVTVSCTNDGCAASMLRNEIPNHHHVCPHRIVPCDKCDASIKQHDLQEHLQHTCPAVEVPCQHKGGCGQMVRRGAKDNHIENECAQAEVKCEVPGCSKAITRGSMKRHLEDSMAEHIMSLSSKVIVLQGANSKLLAVEAELEEAKNEIVALKAELRQVKGSQGAGPSGSQPVAGHGFDCVSTKSSHRGEIAEFAAVGTKLFSACLDGQIGMWHLRDLTEIKLFDEGHSMTHVTADNGVVYCIDKQRGGRTILRAYDVDDDSRIDTLLPQTEAGITNAIAFDGRLCCGFSSNQVQVYTMNRGVVRFGATIDNADSEDKFIISGDRFYSASDAGGVVKVWCLSNFQFLREMECIYWGQGTKTTALAVGNGMLYMAARDRRIRVWDTSNYAYVATVVESPVKTLYTCLAAGNGFLFAGAKHGTIKVWSARDYTRVLAELKEHESTVSALLVHNGMLYSGSMDGEIKMWRIPTQ